MDEAIKIFLVDDLLMREGLVSLLSMLVFIAVVGTAAGGSEAVTRIKVLRPAVALVNIGLPDWDGLTLTQTLRRETPEVKVIMLGVPDLPDEIIRCIEAGAAGYVLKDSSFDHLVATVRAVHHGEAFCSPRVAASLFSRIAELTAQHMPEVAQSSVKLTARELEIVSQIALGLSNKEIAQRFSIAPQTVKNHIHNILDKLQVHTRLQAVHYAHERNLLNKPQ